VTIDKLTSNKKGLRVETVKIIGIFFGSSVFSAFITALFTRNSHEETLTLKYITDERSKWRERIKDVMTQINIAVNSPKLHGERVNKTRVYSTYLKLSLNPKPNHKLDKDILKKLKYYVKTPVILSS
jgi:hypothetical protein